MALNKVGTVPGILRCPEDGERLEERWVRLAGENLSVPPQKGRLVCPKCDAVYEQVEQMGQLLREAATTCLCGVPHPNEDPTHGGTR